MKLEQQNRSDIVSLGDSTAVKARIADESLGFILGQIANLYSDPYGSIVRELTSNCYDAHAMVGERNKPAIVGFMYEDYTEYVFFQDHGIGMTPEFMTTTFMSYGESTKRDTNDVLGAFGMGSKSPFSIRSEYFIDSVVDFVEYNYIIFIDDDGLPTYDLLSEGYTMKENGTTVKILVDNDRYKFVDAFKKHLIYFDNVYFKDAGIDNDFKIYYLSNGRISNKEPFNKLHICYDKVYYPINFDKLDLPEFYLPIGLHFNVGELPVPPTRESILYNDESVHKIKYKILALLYELINRYNKKSDVYVNDLYDIYYVTESNTLKIQDVSIDIDRVRNYLSKIKRDVEIKKVKYKVFEDIGLKNYHKVDFFPLYNFIYENKGEKHYGSFITNTNTKRAESHHFHSASSLLRTPYTNNVYITKAEKLKRTVTNSINENNFYVLKYRTGTKESAKLKKQLYYEIIKTFKLDKQSSLNRNKLYIARVIFKELIKYVEKHTKNYDKVEVKESAKPKRTKSFSQSSKEFVLNDLSAELKKDRKKTFKVYGKYKKLKFIPKKGKPFYRTGLVQVGLTSKYLHVIDVDETSLEILNSIYSNKYYNNKQKIFFYSCTQKQYDLIRKQKQVLGNMNNIINIKEFTKTRAFAKVATSIFITEVLYNKANYRFLKEFRESYDYHNKLKESDFYFHDLVKQLNIEVYDHCVDITNFINNNSINMSDRRIKNELVGEFKENVIQIARRFNLVDRNIVYKLRRCIRFFEGLDLIYDLNVKDDNFKHLISYIKTMKKPLNPEHYNMLYKEYELELWNESIEKTNYNKTLKKVA